MRNLSHQEFKQLTKKAIVLADDEHGKKVLELTDHSIIKLFRVKRFISQASLYSPARRFAKNARKLKKLNIPTISLLDLYKIHSIKRTAVHYKQLEGITVREYLYKNPDNDKLLTQLGAFLAQLHNKGIYFRSAHFGNIIVTPDKQFGLIDVSDMTISPFSLGIFKRLRNLKHIFRITEDIEFIRHNQNIENGYLNHCKINTPFFSRQYFKKKFMQISHTLKSKHN